MCVKDASDFFFAPQSRSLAGTEITGGKQPRGQRLSKDFTTTTPWVDARKRERETELAIDRERQKKRDRERERTSHI